MILPPPCGSCGGLDVALPSLWVKVCGVTTVGDADQVAQAGVDAVGINLWPKSVRYVDVAAARRIADQIRGKVAVVAVCVDFSLAQLQEIQQTLAPDWLQLHGNEPDATLLALGQRVFRAVGLRTPADAERARRALGPWVLVDAYDEVHKGGTGRAPPTALAREVCAARPTILAGGLGPDNVAAAVRSLRPAGVDAASQLESAPGHKDLERVAAFVRAARQGGEHV